MRFGDYIKCFYCGFTFLSSKNKWLKIFFKCPKCGKIEW